MLTPHLPKAKRLTGAELSGVVQRVAWGTLAHLTREEKLAEIWEVTRDPEILGHELGGYLGAEYPTQGGTAAIALLRAAGADEAVAEINAEWQRERQQRERGGSRT